MLSQLLCRFLPQASVLVEGWAFHHSLFADVFVKVEFSRLEKFFAQMRARAFHRCFSELFGQTVADGFFHVEFFSTRRAIFQFFFALSAVEMRIATLIYFSFNNVFETDAYQFLPNIFLSGENLPLSLFGIRRIARSLDGHFFTLED